MKELKFVFSITRSVFGWIFLKREGEVKMDQISDVLENRPDRIVNLNVTPP